MTSIARIALPRSMWDRVKSLAQTRSMQPTEWLVCVIEQAAQRQSVETPPHRPTDTGRSALLETTIRHFRDLYPSPLEARRMAWAIRRAVREGGPIRMGPLGRSGRTFTIERCGGRICLRSLAGPIELSPAEALTLADALTGPYDKPAVMRLAA